MRRICNFCGNKNFVNKQVQYIYRHDQKFLIVENVPCEECEYCGEQYFKAAALKRIEKEFYDVHSYKKKLKKRIEVPVEEFAKLK